MMSKTKPEIKFRCDLEQNGKNSTAILLDLDSCLRAKRAVGFNSSSFLGMSLRVILGLSHQGASNGAQGDPNL